MQGFFTNRREEVAGSLNNFVIDAASESMLNIML